MERPAVVTATVDQGKRCVAHAQCGAEGGAPISLNAIPGGWSWLEDLASRAGILSTAHGFVQPGLMASTMRHQTPSSAMLSYLSVRLCIGSESCLCYF